MKVTITLGLNSFAFEGEVLPVDLFRLWLNAQQPGQDAVKLEELTNRLRTNNNVLAGVVEHFGKDS